MEAVRYTEISVRQLPARMVPEEDRYQRCENPKYRVVYIQILRLYLHVQGEHKFFPRLQTCITRKLRGIQTCLYLY